MRSRLSVGSTDLAVSGPHTIDLAAGSPTMLTSLWSWGQERSDEQHRWQLFRGWVQALDLTLPVPLRWFT